MDNLISFQKDQLVYYRNNDGFYVRARILEKHYDDIEPYYTILVEESGLEKQTIYTRLHSFILDYPPENNARK